LGAVVVITGFEVVLAVETDEELDCIVVNPVSFKLFVKVVAVFTSVVFAIVVFVEIADANSVELEVVVKCPFEEASGTETDSVFSEVKVVVSSEELPLKVVGIVVELDSSCFVEVW